jgi:hypothetical protein
MIVSLYIIMINIIDLNPLQMLREVIQQYELSADDILHKLKKRINDLPLTFPQFKECILKLDSSLSNLQI